jgi:hypothetical protein
MTPAVCVYCGGSDHNALAHTIAKQARRVMVAAFLNGNGTAAALWARVAERLERGGR